MIVCESLWRCLWEFCGTTTSESAKLTETAATEHEFGSAGGARTPHPDLLHFIDYDREVALVAVRDDEIAGVVRLHKSGDGEEAEFGLLISDAHQGKGLGSALLARLIDVARAEGVKKITADIHGENSTMQAMVRKAGFKIRRDLGDPTVRAVLTVW